MQFRRTPPLWTPRKAFWVIYPVALYYGMVVLERSIDWERYFGPDPVGNKIAKLFVFAGASIFLLGTVGSALEYLEGHSGIRPQLARLLYQGIAYPLEYFWFAFSLLMLTASNLHPLGRNPWFTLFLVTAASLGAQAVLGMMTVEKPTLLKAVFFETFTRSMFVAVLSLASLVVFVAIR